jgi:hypothetical protein
MNSHVQIQPLVADMAIGVNRLYLWAAGTRLTQDQRLCVKNLAANSVLSMSTRKSTRKNKTH